MRGVLPRLLVLLALGACAHPSRAPAGAEEVGALLAAYRRAAVLAADEQRREFNAAKTAYDTAATDAARLRLALALQLPRVRGKDDARARALLGEIEPPREGASMYYDLAQALLGVLAAGEREQRQLSEQLREERRRGDEIQQKLESLRAIERDLRRRP